MAYWLACSACDTKVAGSNPARVTEFFLSLSKTVNFSLISASEGT